MERDLLIGGVAHLADGAQQVEREFSDVERVVVAAVGHAGHHHVDRIAERLGLRVRSTLAYLLFPLAYFTTLSVPSLPLSARGPISYSCHVQ